MDKMIGINHCPVFNAINIYLAKEMSEWLLLVTQLGFACHKTYGNHTYFLRIYRYRKEMILSIIFCGFIFCMKF